MSDVKDLLREAVGTYEPRADQRAIEERIHRHGRRRRIAAAVLGVFVFLIGGALAFRAFTASEGGNQIADNSMPSLAGSLVLSVGVGDGAGTTRLYVVEPDGSGHRDAGADGTELQIEGALLAISPDGTRLVYVRFGTQDRGLWVSNVDGSDAVRLTEATENGDQDPAWSPDGEQIVFSRNRVGHGELFVVDADGTDLRQLTTNDVGQDLEPAWSPDGSTIVFTRNSGGPVDLWTVEDDGTDLQQLTTFNEQEFGGPEDADWSPDGTMIVLSARQPSSNEAPDRFDRDLWVIDVTAPETPRTPWRLTDSIRDEISPTWSPDGTSIAFLAGSETVASGHPDGRGPYSSFIVDVPSGVVRELSAPPGSPFSGSSLQWSRGECRFVDLCPPDLVGSELADALGLTPHEWSGGQTLETRSGGVYLDGEIPEGCASMGGDVVIVQQVGDGTFYCARGIDEFQAWMLGQRLIGSTPTPQDIQDQRSTEPRPHIGGMPEDADGDGLISDSGPERIPELIRASGDSGVLGYVRYQDLQGPQPANPAQAVELSGKPWIVPLYAEDGITIIDRYTLAER